MFEPLSYLNEKIRLTEDLQTRSDLYFQKYLKNCKSSTTNYLFLYLHEYCKNTLKDLNDSKLTILSLQESSNEIN